MEWFRKRSAARNALAVSLMICTGTAPLHVAAASNVGKEAQAFGTQLFQQFQMPAESGDGKIIFEGGQTISAKDLYPGGSTGDTSKFFPAGVNVAGATAIYDSGQQMENQGNESLGTLWEDANSDNPTIYGAAYKILLDKKELAKPDLRNDPILSPARAILGNADMLENEFTGCTTETVFSVEKKPMHIPDYKRCQALYKPKGNCEITHEIKIKAKPTDLVFVIDNSGSMDKVILALRSSINTVAALLGSENSGNLRIGAISSRSYASTYINLTSNIPVFQNWINNLWLNSGTTYTTDTVNFAMTNFSWRNDPSVEKVFVIVGNEDNAGGDYMALKRRLDAQNFKVFIFHDNASVKALGQYIHYVFDTAKLYKASQQLTVIEDYWTPQSCIDDAIATLEEFCDGTYWASQGGGRCVMLSGFEVCEGEPIYNQLKPPPFPGVSRLATKVMVSGLTCDYNKGPMECYTDVNGIQRCPQNNAELTNTCKKYEENPACGFIKSECVGGALGSQGNCYVTEQTWDCGETVYADDLTKTETYQCPGEIRCMGADCIDPQKTKSGEFSRAAALLNTAQFLSEELECDISAINNPNACAIFKGEQKECKTALGGYVDCCESPGGVSMGEYLAAILAVGRLDSAIMSANSTGVAGAIKSGYMYLREPVVEGFQAAVKPFSSYFDSISAAYDQMGTAVEGVVAELKQKAQEIFAELAKDMGIGGIEGAAGGGAAAESAAQAGQAAGQQAASTLGTTALNAIAVVGWIYTAYQMAKLLIAIIYECEKDELELGVQIEMKQCTFQRSYCADKILGSCIEKREVYCCYSSPLARIIQEQVGRQLGRPTGICSGLTLADLDRIDWDKVDLQEWTGMLKKHDLLPSAANIDLESLTGAGSALDTGDRLNSVERTKKRFEGADIDGTRIELSNTYNPSVGAPKK